MVQIPSGFLYCITFSLQKQCYKWCWYAQAWENLINPDPPVFKGYPLQVCGVSGLTLLEQKSHVYSSQKDLETGEFVAGVR